MARVLMVCEPPDGGVSENAVQLSERLGAEGFEVEFAGPPEARRHPRLDAAGVAIHRLPLAPGYGNAVHDARALRGLAALMRRRSFDLVHCHSSKAGVLGRLAARAAGTPAIFAPHSFSFVGDFSPARRRIALGIERALAPLTAAVVCCCEDERRIALEHRVAAPARLHVVHNACEACAECAPDATLSGMRERGPVAASVAALRPQKTLEVFLDAVPRVLERMPGVQLAMVGDGPLRGRLEAHAARLGLDGDERFAMLPFEAPAARYLRAMDVFVLPSAWEGFPIGVLEALACGVPQVATDVGGTREAVTAETGRLVARHDPEALAAAIVEVLEDPVRRERMAQASRARHAEHFSIDRMVAGTTAVYRHVLAGKAG